MKPAELTAEEQTAILAERYSQRAEAYDKFWSPVIRPAGERLVSQLPLGSASSIIDVGTGAGALFPAIARAAPSATILGVDRSEGMLRLARKKYPGWLALMDVQTLALSAYRFDAAVVANPIDAFAGASGEASAREFGTLGYSIRARKPVE